MSLNEIVSQFFSNQDYILAVGGVVLLIITVIGRKALNVNVGITPDPVVLYRRRQNLNIQIIIGGIAVAIEGAAGAFLINSFAANQATVFGVSNDSSPANLFMYVELALVPIGLLGAYWGYKKLRANKSPEEANAPSL